MKRFVSALAFCFLLLVTLGFFLFPPVEAKDNVLLALLNLPAPPPPNPLVTVKSRSRDPKFYDKSAPPKDSAPIDELLDYWKQQNSLYQKLRYSPEMPETSRERIMREIDKDPNLLTNYLHVLAGDPKAADFVKEIYDREGTGGVFSREQRGKIKRWLTFNSPYFSNDLYRLAQQAGDTTDSYVSNQEELLALTHVDFDKAQPLIDRLYANSSQRVSQVLAKWALYRHALDTGSTSDIDRYRDELKAVVEDKTGMDGMRDLAMDALVSEKEWPGRDKWYYGLLSDESLVNMPRFTGLTTLMLVSPEEKYVEKMLEMVKNDNPAVRGAAVRNLIGLERSNPEIIRAFLPWLEDPKWAVSASDTRASVIAALAAIEMPESVPGLLKVMDEKAAGGDNRYRAANTMANAANTAVNSMSYSANVMANMMANVANAMANTYSYKGSTGSQAYYPYRSEAIRALAMQKDIRAVPALRRVLYEVEGYERDGVVKTLIQCHGFSVTEQLDGVETVAKNIRANPELNVESVYMSNVAANAPRNYTASGVDYYYSSNTNTAPHPFGPADVKQILGHQLIHSSEVSDELAHAVEGRIEILDAKEPALAKVLRGIVLKWQGTAIDILLLRDLKNGKAESEAIVRLLSERAGLRERLPNEVGEAKTGTPTAAGIAACISEDPSELASMLVSENIETKTATLACARLIRASLPVSKVAEFVRSPDKLLALAAERYLESEDSPQARTIVLSLHPNEAKIMGARSCFQVEGSSPYYGSEYLVSLFASISETAHDRPLVPVCDYADDLDTLEKRLQKEVKDYQELLGVYAFSGNFVKIYKDKVLFSWDDDDSRYHERALTGEEFDRLKDYMAVNRVDDLKPFLDCVGECSNGELIMLGRNGGRRVFYKSTGHIDFFAGLGKFFDDLKLTPAKLKYTLSKDLPGLEILFADDNHNAETVWKNSDDLRILASDTKVRKKVDEDVADLEDEYNEDPDIPAPDLGRPDYSKITKVRASRSLEGFAWYRLAKDGAAEPAAQPPQMEYFPPRDGLAVQPTAEQWKARAGNLEFRADETGLFKVTRGQISKMLTGSYGSPVLTPNGRWVVATKYDEDSGSLLVRVNVATGKEYKVEFERFPSAIPKAFIPSINKVLVMGKYEGEGGDYDPDAAEGPYFLLDPETGTLQPAPGEYRPLEQQTFRPLQHASKPNEFWAALPDTSKKETVVGIYDINHFGFKQVLKIPKMVFDSMAMWVDEPAGKVYFVYRGHLLSLPLGKQS